MLHYIKCPSCGETLEVNSSSGVVEKHYKDGNVKKGKGDFFKERLAALKKEEESRSGRFDMLKEEKGKRIKALEQRFVLEKEKVKKNKEEIKPDTPFDFD